ncbi:hypothetical protein SISNIDRAFT_468090 [Sistotremastrum niveocremeum HHB9708]|uniref:Uncharacterized protein n=1 Tax=Sistotremastrum niveocremeum HHB9708 TaxID=1314777 RepID=A0A164RSM5_9AGAM|nr:hypothetical protein SISNIDRAFT_468090 [Sistotremastrum niveocremeum HHB9708]
MPRPTTHVNTAGLSPPQPLPTGAGQSQATLAMLLHQTTLERDDARRQASALHSKLISIENSLAMLTRPSSPDSQSLSSSALPTQLSGHSQRPINGAAAVDMFLHAQKQLEVANTTLADSETRCRHVLEVWESFEKWFLDWSMKGHEGRIALGSTIRSTCGTSSAIRGPQPSTHSSLPHTTHLNNNSSSTARKELHIEADSTVSTQPLRKMSLSDPLPDSFPSRRRHQWGRSFDEGRESDHSIDDMILEASSSSTPRPDSGGVVGARRPTVESSTTNTTTSSDLTPSTATSLTSASTMILATPITESPIQKKSKSASKDPIPSHAKSIIYPSMNAEGQRTCRQCGSIGRYKDGKCVEKWGPGPSGPGTVCDRCRKKTKRQEKLENRVVGEAISAAPLPPASSSFSKYRSATSQSFQHHPGERSTGMAEIDIQRNHSRSDYSRVSHPSKGFDSSLDRHSRPEHAQRDEHPVDRDNQHSSNIHSRSTHKNQHRLSPPHASLRHSSLSADDSQSAAHHNPSQTRLGRSPGISNRMDVDEDDEVDADGERDDDDEIGEADSSNNSGIKPTTKIEVLSPNSQF